MADIYGVVQSGLDLLTKTIVGASGGAAPSSGISFGTQSSTNDSTFQEKILPIMVVLSQKLQANVFAWWFGETIGITPQLIPINLGMASSGASAEALVMNWEGGITAYMLGDGGATVKQLPSGTVFDSVALASSSAAQLPPAAPGAAVNWTGVFVIGGLVLGAIMLGGYHGRKR